MFVSSATQVSPRLAVSLINRFPAVTIARKAVIDHLKEDCWRAEVQEIPEAALMLALSNEVCVTHTHTHTHTHTYGCLMSVMYIKSMLHQPSRTRTMCTCLATCARVCLLWCVCAHVSVVVCTHTAQAQCTCIRVIRVSWVGCLWLCTRLYA